MRARQVSHSLLGTIHPSEPPATNPRPHPPSPSTVTEHLLAHEVSAIEGRTNRAPEPSILAQGSDADEKTSGQLQ